MEQAGPPSEPPGKRFSPGRGDRPVAQLARPILRKPVGASQERAHPADAFYPEAPCPRATTEAFRNCQTFLVTPAEPEVYPRAIRWEQCGCGWNEEGLFLIGEWYEV